MSLTNFRSILIFASCVVGTRNILYIIYSNKKLLGTSTLWAPTTRQRQMHGQLETYFCSNMNILGSRRRKLPGGQRLLLEQAGQHALRGDSERRWLQLQRHPHRLPGMISCILSHSYVFSFFPLCSDMSLRSSKFSQHAMGVDTS